MRWSITVLLATFVTSCFRPLPSRQDAAPDTATDAACGAAAPDDVATSDANARACPSGPGCREIAELAVGNSHNCARLTDGTVWCWGLNTFFQLGHEPGSIDSMCGGANGMARCNPRPTEIVGLRDAISVSAGAISSCAVAGAERRVYCWGSNVHGELGDGTNLPRPVPTQPVIDEQNQPLEHVRTVVNDSAFHACAVTEAGGVYCWGLDVAGETGVPLSTPRSMPINGTMALFVRRAHRVGLPGLARSVSVGFGSSCAILADDESAWCWGNNDSGQLGNGGMASSARPVHVDIPPSPAARVRSLGVGFVSACAVIADGSVWCWGANYPGTMGPASHCDPPDAQNPFRCRRPVLVPGLPPMQDITLGYYGGCARDAMGRIFCWGFSNVGQLGVVGTSPCPQPPDAGTAVSVCVAPPREIPSLQGAEAVGIGLGHSCVRGPGCAVRCVGISSQGQLGDGVVSDAIRTMPTTVLW